MSTLNSIVIIASDWDASIKYEQGMLKLKFPSLADYEGFRANLRMEYPDTFCSLNASERFAAFDKDYLDGLE